MNRLLILILLILSTIELSSQEINQSMVDFLNDKGMEPKEYIIHSFESNDVIFLGESHLVKQNLEFVQSIIPELYKNGIYNLGMEFGTYEDQHTLDSLVTASVYDEQLAEVLMFNYNTTWGYKEYIDIYRGAWELNHLLPEEAPKFRIVNLSYRFNWNGFTSRTPESMRKVFSKGPPDKFRADVIEIEVLDKNQKILALVGTPHAFTRYRSLDSASNATNYSLFDHKWLGNILFDTYPDRVFSIMLHQAVYSEVNGSWRMTAPGNNLTEQLMKQNNYQPIGFDLIRSPVGEISDDSYYSLGYKNFTLDQLFDGYIFLQPLEKFKGCSCIKGFITDSNLQEALNNFPDPDWHELVTNKDELINFIQSNADRIEVSVQHHFSENKENVE